MSSLSTYYLAIHTGVDYPSDTYDSAAGKLVDLLTRIFSSRDTVSSLTNCAPDSVSSEIEVLLESDPRELVGKAVVDILATQKVKFDKNKFSRLVKGSPEAELWPMLKIVKRQVEAAPEAP